MGLSVMHETKQVNTNNKDLFSVIGLIESYFDGVYYADSKKLKAIFHSDAYLKAPDQRRDLSTWLEDVESREIPYELGLPYDFKILSIEIIQDQAMVKVDCPLFDHLYVDFLGLLKEQGDWKIVNKMYTDLRR